MTSDGRGVQMSVKSPDVGPANLLSYGTQVALDGRAAAGDAIESREMVADFVSALIEQVEAESGALDASTERPLARMLPVEQQSTPGVSAVVIWGETAIVVHTFTELGRLTMRLVSARKVPIDLVISEFKRAFSVGRYQSHVTSRFRTFPTAAPELERFLAGERAYARLRLDVPLAL